MSLCPCSHQHEVEIALRERQWPESCSAELQSHVNACPSCKELVLLASSLRQARQESMQIVRLPPSGLLWWRAQLRQRNAAMERVTKPILLVEGLGLAGMVLAAVALTIGQRKLLASWLGEFANRFCGDAFGRADALWSANPGMSFWAVIIASVAMIGLAGGVAAYLARSE